MASLSRQKEQAVGSAVQTLRDIALYLKDRSDERHAIVDDAQALSYVEDVLNRLRAAFADDIAPALMKD